MVLAVPCCLGQAEASVRDGCVQVLLRWALQEGCCVIPKSVQRDRIQAATWQALSGWVLQPDHMHSLNALESGRKICWDPADIA